MTSIGYAVLQIIPSLKGVSEAIEKELAGKVVDLNVKPTVDAKAAEQAGKDVKAVAEKQTADVKVAPKVDVKAAEQAGRDAKASVEKHAGDAKVAPKADKPAAEQAGKDVGAAATKGASTATSGIGSLVTEALATAGGIGGTLLGAQLAKTIPTELSGTAERVGTLLRNTLPAVGGAAGSAAGAALGVGLSAAVKNEHVQAIGKKIATGLVKSFGSDSQFQSAGKSVARGLTKAVSSAEVSSGVAVALGGALTNGLDGASGFLANSASSLTDTISGITAGIGSAKEALGGNDSWAAPGLDVLTDALGKAGPLIDGVTTASNLAATGTVAMSAATKIAAAVQWAMNAAMAANPLGLIVAAIAAVVAGLVLFFTKTEIGQKIWSTFVEVLKAAWEGIKVAFAAAWDFIKGVFEGMVSKAGEVWTGIKEKFTSIVDFVKGLPGKITAAAKGMWEGLKSGLATIVNWIGGKINPIINTINGLKNKIPGVGGTIPDLPTFPTSGFDSGGYTGNIPVDKVAGVVHGGEFVLKAPSTAKIENAYPGLLDFLNRQGRLPGFDQGGFVPKGAEGLNPGAEYLRDLVMKNWPSITRIGGRRSEDGYGEHSSGNAIDIMIPNYGSPDGIALGNSVLAFLQSNGAAMDINGIIWQRMSYGYGHGLGKAQDYGDHGGDTANHMDHLHVILGGGRRSGAPAVGMPSGTLSGLPSAEKQKPVPSSALDLASKPTASSGTGSGGGSGAIQLADSFSGLSAIGPGSIPALKTKVTPDSPERTFDIGAAAGTAVSGQVSSALNVFGIGDSPGFLKAANKLISGISVGGPTGGGAPDTSAAPAAAKVPSAAAVPSMAASTPAQGGGNSTVFNISTARTEDAFVEADQRKKEQAAAKLTGYAGN